MSKRGMDLTKLAGEFGLLVTQGRFTHTHTHARIHLSRALFYPRYSPLPCDDAVFPKSARRTLDFFRTPPRNTVEPSPVYTGSCVSLSSVIVPGGYIFFLHAKHESVLRQSLSFLVLCFSVFFLKRTRDAGRDGCRGIRWFDTHPYAALSILFTFPATLQVLKAVVNRWFRLSRGGDL
jgi:hypothetical protein